MRNAIGIFDLVWAGDGDRVQLPTFETGYDYTYAVDRAPDRRHMNDVLAKVTALCVDVNKFGAAMPWNSGQVFEQYAVVTGSDGVVYVAAQQNQNKDPSVAGNQPVYWKAFLTPLQDFVDGSTTKSVTPNAVQKYVDTFTLNKSGAQIYNDAKANYMWHTLDLSGIVGNFETMAHIRVDTNGSAYGSIGFKTFGSTESWLNWNYAQGVRGGAVWIPTGIPSSPTNAAHPLSVQVPTSSTGKVEFCHEFSGGTSVRMTLEFWQRIRTL